MDKKELVNFLIDNFVEDNGDLDLRFLDFSDFDGNVLISGWKVRENLFQHYQKVGGNLLQDFQHVEGNLYQDKQFVKGNLYQDIEGDYND